MAKDADFHCLGKNQKSSPAEEPVKITKQMVICFPADVHCTCTYTVCICINVSLFFNCPTCFASKFNDKNSDQV